MTLSLNEWVECLGYLNGLTCDCGAIFFYCEIHAEHIECPCCGLDYS